MPSRSTFPSNTSPGKPAQPAAPAQAAPQRRSTAGEKTICSLCKKEWSTRSFADHTKVHKLEGSGEGAQALRPCTRCKDPSKCRVAKRPKELGTYARMCCLKNHRACSFKDYGRAADMATGDKWIHVTHPALVPEPQPSESWIG
ncbi:hypothetical protein F53441_7613 [Fusarium austroafricanum]|uniref:Uncharacterized protein n=1 Tax=Fusarium austroafricanum TaxID=2364996 RepID=A0A8H4NS11_9HYPO|nr:hypothetical protein F53441_7613 [Fusarium austroafricanum]